MANYFCTDSVEEQVDYLTDKVTDLNTKKLDKAAIVQGVGTGTDVVMSQKAVTDTINQNLQTVNESLQTINTEINGKLTAPTTPTADSAVTMLADGTVGTKLLSEIGGGGKLFRHSIFANWSDITTNIRLDIIKDSDTVISQSEFQTYVSTFTIVMVGGLSGNGVGSIYHDSHEYTVNAVVIPVPNTGTPQILNLNKAAFDSFTDTVTEL